MVGVTDRGAPIQDIAKQQRLHQVLTEMLGGEGSVVRHETVRLRLKGRLRVCQTAAHESICLP